MPFERPDLSTLREQAATDINGSLSGIDALLRYSNLGVIGEVLAGLVDGLYGYLDWIALQSVPFTATGEFLEGWAGLKGVIRKPASFASGTAVFAANGGTVPAGTAINRSDGFAYVSTADATAVGNSIAIPIAATVAGAGGNAASGTILTLGGGIAGVSGTGEAAGPLAGGAEIEKDDDLKSRMIAEYSAPPQGGSSLDYREWALSVPGVTRVWVVPSGMGPGTVIVQFMMDDAEAAFGGFPQGTNGCATLETRAVPATGDQLLVANTLFALQPVTPLVYVVAPVPNEISLTIAGIAGVSAAIKTAIFNAVVTALRVNAVPGGLTPVSAIEAAIAAVSSTSGFVLTGITASAGAVSPGAAGNITSSAGALPVLVSIAYV